MPGTDFKLTSLIQSQMKQPVSKSKPIHKTNKRTSNRRRNNRGMISPIVDDENSRDEPSPIKPTKVSYEVDLILPYEQNGLKKEVKQSSISANCFQSLKPITSLNPQSQSNQSSLLGEQKWKRASQVKQTHQTFQKPYFSPSCNSEPQQIVQSSFKSKQLSPVQDSDSDEKNERTITEKYQDSSYHAPLGFVEDSDEECQSDDESRSLVGVAETPTEVKIEEDKNLNIKTRDSESKQAKLGLFKEKQANNLKFAVYEESVFSKETTKYLLQRMNCYQFDSKLIQNQNPEITPKNRQILIDWLMEVSDKFQLKRQTFYLAVNFADRYLLKVGDYELESYQKLGITCLLIACKIEEIYYPKHLEFQSVTDDNCSLDDILSLETDVLQRLNWMMNPVSLSYWANYYMHLWERFAKSNPFNFYLLDKSTQFYSSPEVDRILKQIQTNSNQSLKGRSRRGSFKASEGNAKTKAISKQSSAKSRKAEKTKGLEKENYQSPMKIQQRLRDLKEKEQFDIPQFKSSEPNHYFQNFRQIIQALDLALLDLDHYLIDARFLAAAALVLTLSIGFERLSIKQIETKINQAKAQNRQKQQQFSQRLSMAPQRFSKTPSVVRVKEETNELDWFYEEVLCVENEEYSHMVMNFLENECDLRVSQLKPALRYMQLFYTIPLQQQLPSKLEEQEAASQEEFYSYQVHYQDIPQIMAKINSLKTDLKIL